MHAISFSKYQGTGNDFVMIDNRQGVFPKDDLELVQSLCDRKFGIGADGLILIENHPSADFEMIYFNSDGSQSLCGNGSRCAVRFAEDLGLVADKTLFLAIDGMHEAIITPEEIHLKMNPVSQIEKIEDDSYLHTGSPHYIRWTSKAAEEAVVAEGARIRYSEKFSGQNGTNVNFVEVLPNNVLFVRTYERGVEDETLSCGTGVTAAALAATEKNLSSPVHIQTKGGNLAVSFDRLADGSFDNIYLIGPAKKVFEGKISV